MPLPDTGRYNEIIIGVVVLFKLFGLGDVYAFQFGMERREFGKFDDIVVGIQPKEEEEMHYYAFQLKGCDGQQKYFGPEFLFHELAPPNRKLFKVTRRESADCINISDFNLHSDESNRAVLKVYFHFSFQ
jgi:hypothetical protein